MKPAAPTGGAAPARSAGAAVRAAPIQGALPTISFPKMLLSIAYGVKAHQISRPAWLDSERYNTTATIPEGTTKEQFSVMLQNLLTDRFGAKLHHETRDLPMYELSVAQGGPRLKASVADPSVPDAPLPPPTPGLQPVGKGGFPRLPAGRNGMMMLLNPKGFHVAANVQPIPALSDMLGNQLASPVVDKTGLTGTYEYILDFSRDSVQGRGLPGLPRSLPPSDGAAGPGPAPRPRACGGSNRRAEAVRPAAVQEQLGLRLEKKRGPLDVIVIDRAEKAPTEN